MYCGVCVFAEDKKGGKAELRSILWRALQRYSGRRRRSPGWRMVPKGKRS